MRPVNLTKSTADVLVMAPSPDRPSGQTTLSLVCSLRLELLNGLRLEYGNSVLLFASGRGHRAYCRADATVDRRNSKVLYFISFRNGVRKLRCDLFAFVTNCLEHFWRTKKRLLRFQIKLDFKHRNGQCRYPKAYLFSALAAPTRK